MTITNKIFRPITLGLQLIAIAAYFLPPLFLGGHFGILWLVLGVIHTVLFSAMFFRNARSRTALSIIFMIVLILWSLLLFLSGALLILVGTLNFGLAVYPRMFIYIATTFLAAIFALAFPRRFPKPATEAEALPPECTEAS